MACMSNWPDGRLLASPKTERKEVDIMQQLTERRTSLRLGQRMAGAFLSLALLVWVLAMPCKASVFGPEPAPGSAPETETADTQGEGMLSPSSGSSKGSVFGQATTKAASTDERIERLLPQVQSSLPSGNGSWSVYICDLETNSEGSISSHGMQAASLIKLFIMGAVYENYELLSQQYGQSAVDSYLHSMITVSDNDAANALVNYLGGGDSSVGMQVVNNYCAAHDYKDTVMGRLLLQSKENGDNITSVSDCGHFLKEVYEKNDEKDEAGMAMFSLLAAQTRRNKIPAQMPEGVSVANKTGELSDVENDAGILYDTSNDLVLVFMSENLSQVGGAQSTIASISRSIYDYYQS